jgi:hypothetical protein
MAAASCGSLMGAPRGVVPDVTFTAELAIGQVYSRLAQRIRKKDRKRLRAPLAS